MKQHTLGTIRHLAPRNLLCALAISFALAPLAGAQPPAPTAPAASAAPAAPGPAAAPAPTPPPPPAISNDQASYLFGLMQADQMRSYGMTTEDITEAFSRGLKEGLGQGKRLSQDDQKQIQEFVRQKVTAAQARNKTAADDFLAKNGKEKSVKTTASGLEYKVIAAGDLKAPAITASDEVTVNYRGKFMNNVEFDSSYSHGTPTPFFVGRVIKGWQEALQLMKPGAKYLVYVPPDLAYGPNPRPGIPPNSLLIFDVELVSVKPKAEGAGMPGGRPPGMPPAPGGPATTSPPPPPRPAPQSSPTPN